MSSPDAIVIGAGPNGLVAANYLADEGWDVVVLEAQAEPGGAVRSGPLTGRPDFIHDYFSAFYPFAVASPAMDGLELETHGLRWRRSPVAVAQPTGDGRCALLSNELEETVASLESFAAGDGEVWREIYRTWTEVGDDMLEILLGPFPPVLAVARLAAALGPSRLLPQLRFWTLPIRRMAEESFQSPHAGLLLAGNALHADLAPEMAGSGFFGLLLCSLGQQLGFPVPEGGAGNLTGALVRRLESRGGTLVCNARVNKVDIRSGKAVGVTIADGTHVAARRAILADVAAPALYLDLVGQQHLTPSVVAAIEHFQFDNGTVKVDWALEKPIPWAAEEAGAAGTVHITDSMDHLTESSAQLAMGKIPGQPYLVLGQMNAADPTRSPQGTSTVWAYTHVPQQVRGDAGGTLTGKWDESETEQYLERIEAEVEKHAPGFRNRIIGTYVRTPPLFEQANENLVGGALGAGTSQLHQQLVFRPIPGMAGHRTPVRNLYLCSASSHPGGGVHGAPGANAARAALLAQRVKHWSAAGAAGLGGAAFSRAWLRGRAR